MSSEKGFSLIEMMMVVAIIGILIAIVIPSYKVYVRRSHYLEIIQAAIPYKINVTECFQVTSDISECGGGKNGVPTGDHETHGIVKTIDVSGDGKITVTPELKYGLTDQDQYTLTPIVRSGKLFWISGGGGVAHGYAN